MRHEEIFATCVIHPIGQEQDHIHAERGEQPGLIELSCLHLQMGGWESRSGVEHEQRPPDLVAFHILSSHVARAMAISRFMEDGYWQMQTLVLGSISMPSYGILELHSYHGMVVESGQLGCVS